MRKAPKKCPLCKSLLVSLALDSGGVSTKWCPECGVVVKWDCITKRVKETITPRMVLKPAISGVNMHHSNKGD